jgi:methionine--tRNA ligase beta chain
MEFQLDQAIDILRRTPATLNALLRGVPDAWTMGNEGPDTWSPYDILGHLIHGEQTDWIPRARIILEHGESRAFEPFDRFAQFEKSKGKSPGELLDEFEALRKRNLTALEEMKITSDQLTRRGRHPELGSVTLGELLATWVAHDLSHIAQAVRVMCKQYSEAVGPWKEYLPLLKPSNPSPIKPSIPLDVLETIDVRVGTIERLDEVKGSNKLVKLTVNFGDHKRTILAGMKQEREQPKEIEGKQALFVVNLEPRKMMGEVSEGMLFDIGYADGLSPVLAVPEKEVPNGTRAG